MLNSCPRPFHLRLSNHLDTPPALVVDVGEDEWGGSGELTFDIQWLRCDSLGEDCTPVAEGAAEYHLTVGDIGHRLRAAVTGTPEFGEPVTVVTDLTDVVAPRPIVPGEVVLAGVPQVTERLIIHVNRHAWESSSSLDFDAVWWRCLGEVCEPVGDRGLYDLTGEDVDATLHVVLTATDAWGNTRTVTSNAVGPVVGVDEPAIWVDVDR